MSTPKDFPIEQQLFPSTVLKVNPMVLLRKEPPASLTARIDDYLVSYPGREPGYAKMAVAEDKDTPLDALRWLHRHHSFDYELAVNPSIPASMLKTLYRRTCNPLKSLNKRLGIYPVNMGDGILRRIATNPNTSMELLNKLKKHPSDSVRLATAKNPHLPLTDVKSILSGILATKPTNSYVIYVETLDHPQVDPDERNKAIRGLVEDVEFNKRFSEDYPFDEIFDEEKMMTYLFYELLQKLAFDQTTVEAVYNSPVKEFRTSLFRNVNLQPSSYEFFFKQSNLKELEVLASNPALPKDILETLVDEAVEVVSRREHSSSHDILAISLAENPSLPQNSLQKLADLYLVSYIKDDHGNTSVNPLAHPTNTTRAIYRNLLSNPSYQPSH